MRLSDLLRRNVIAADGQPLGRVVDVRLIQDGPVLESFGAAFRVEEMIVGRRAIGIRLGYGRRTMTGPWLLSKLFGRFAQAAHIVPFDDVESIGEESIRLKIPAASVRRLGDD